MKTFDETQPGTWCIVDMDARAIIARGTARQIHRHIQETPRYHGTGARKYLICEDITTTPEEE